MNKTLLVFKNEFINTITRRSFIITLFLIPLVSFLVFTGISLAQNKAPGLVGQVFSPTPKSVVEGYVDESGLIRELPAWVEPGRLVAYTDIAQARQALADERIVAYYVVASDYLTSGEVTYVRPDFNPLSGIDQASTFLAVLHYNLIGANPNLDKLIQNPIQVERVSLSAEPQRDANNMLTFFLPYGVAMLFYIVILTSASFMLNSVTSEKQNRVLEILMASINPLQMLSGKIAALGLVGLLQTLIWSGTGLGLLRLSGRTFNLPAAFQLPVSILVWGAVFFLLGYAIYAGLMAGAGALVPNLREASQLTTVIIVPMVIPLLFLSALINTPQGALATGLSLFPLTAPVAMMTRLAAGDVPFWQPLLSAALMAVTAVLILRGVAGMFRAQTLLAGQAFGLKRYLAALAGKG
jgi:ABC-2 type transport system permease protein